METTSSHIPIQSQVIGYSNLRKQEFNASRSYQPLDSIVNLRKSRLANSKNSMSKVFCNLIRQTRCEHVWSRPCLVTTLGPFRCFIRMNLFLYMESLAASRFLKESMNVMTFELRITSGVSQPSISTGRQQDSHGWLLRMKSSGLRRKFGLLLQTMLPTRFSKHLTSGHNQR